MAEQPDFREALHAALARELGDVQSMGDLARLSGGASQETWAFTLVTKSGGARKFILRRTPGGAATAGGAGAAIGLPTEAAVIEAARAAGVAAPAVVYVLKPEDGAGVGYVMARIEGETLARKILRDAEFDAVRPRLAAQCGEAMARIHATPLEGLPHLPRLDGQGQLRQYYERYQSYDQPKPVFELAFKWLKDNLKERSQLVLVHGDFRNGNIMVHPGLGMNAVLDWELAHIGDPLEDLGWICVNSWRFGIIDKPVGGFGAREDLFAGYEAVSGAKVDAARVRFWEIVGTLRWGVICTMSGVFLRGDGPFTVERPMIARRASETELDLLNLLEGTA